MEGSLFLLKRRKEPRFQMMVLNKLSTGAVRAVYLLTAWAMGACMGQ